MANHRAERRTPARRSTPVKSEATPKPAASTGGKRKATKASRSSRPLLANRASSSRTRPQPARRDVATVPHLEPVQTPEPVTADIPVVHEPVVHEPVVHEPVVHEPVVHEPAISEPIYPGHARTAPEGPRPLVAPVTPAVHEPTISEAALPAPAPRLRVSSGQHSGGRKRPRPGLPSAPSLIGAAALALAAVGATVSQASQAPSVEFQKFAAQASVLNAASSIGSSDALAGRQRAVSRDSQREAMQDAADAQLLAAAESQARERNAALAALAASAEKHANQIARNAWQLPLPVGSFQMSYNFGECSYLWANCHTGEDFSAPTGTPIYAVGTGVVTFAGDDGSYGNKTVITHEDGTETWYAHQTTILVSVGETVRAGDQIGTVGSTGNSTGPHLHLEVRPGGGDPVDPIGALRVRGVDI